LKQYNSEYELVIDLDLDTDIMSALVDIYRDIKGFKYDPEKKYIYSKNIKEWDNNTQRDYNGITFTFFQLK